MDKSIYRKPLLALAFIIAFLAVAVRLTANAAAQEVAYCKHGQTGEVIVIEANYACPYGYYRI